jgi:Tol biopolymer transport system component
MTMRRIFLTTLVVTLALGFSAWGQFLGTDPRLDWWKVETEHFLIIFHNGLEEMAQEAAVLAESAYEFWERELDYHVEDKTKIYLIDNSDLDGGAASPTNQIIGIVPSEARTMNEWLNSRVQSPLDVVILHEHGHIVDLVKVNGISSSFREMFGNTIVPTVFKPPMLTEGIPIYFEMLRSGNSRSNDPRQSMYFRQMVIEDKLMPFDDILSFHPRQEWPSWYMVTHDVGPWVVRYLGETFGSDSIERFDRAMAEDPLALTPFLSQVFGQLVGVPIPPLVPDFGSVIKRATGVTGEEFARGFDAWLTETFEQEVRQIGNNPITESQRLSSIDFWNNKPAWSPNGEWLAYFHSDPVRGSQLRVMRADGSEDQPIVLNEPGFAFFRPHFWSPIPSWSPDGKQLVYADINLDDRYYLRSDLYSYDLETGKRQRLTEGERAYRPVFTPDGKNIIYGRYEWGGRSPDLYEYDIASGKKRLLKRLPENSLLDSFSLSPDGETLALSLWMWGGYQDIYLMSSHGGELIPITQDMATDLDPTWTPDGTSILFSSDRTGVNNLYAYDFDERTYYRITNVLSGAFHPNVSPLGTEIAFTGYNSEGYTIEKMGFSPSNWSEIDKPEFEELPERIEYDERFVIEPYDAEETLDPNGWAPRVSPTRVGVALSGVEALFQQQYNINVGYDFEFSRPYYSLNYNSNAQVPPFTWSIDLLASAQGTRQGINLSYPLVQKLGINENITLGIARSYFNDEIRSSLSLSWGINLLSGIDLIKNRLNMRVSGMMTNIRERDAWEHQVTFSLNDQIHLPVVTDHRLNYHVSLGWSDTDDNFRLGGRNGPMALRGHARGALSGSQFALTRLEYRFTMLPLNYGFGTFPLFLRDLRARVFSDLGTAGEELGFNFENWKVGLGAELQLSATLNYRFTDGIRAGIAMDAETLESEFYFDFGTAF